MNGCQFNKIPKFSNATTKRFPTNLKEITDVEKMKNENAKKVFSNPKIKNVLKKLANE